MCLAAFAQNNRGTASNGDGKIIDATDHTGELDVGMASALIYVANSGLTQSQQVAHLGRMLGAHPDYWAMRRHPVDIDVADVTTQRKLVGALHRAGFPDTAYRIRVGG